MGNGRGSSGDAAPAHEPGDESGDEALPTDPPPPTPPRLDTDAMFRADAAALVRSGHLLRAARMIAPVPAGYESALEPLFQELSDEGYPTEVAVLRISRTHPQLLLILQDAARAGLVGGALAVLAFIYPLWFFAAVPGMAARIVVTELYLRAVGRRLWEQLSPDERSAARTLFDVSVFSTQGTRRLAFVDAVMLTICGVGVYAVVLATRDRLAQPFATIWGTGAVLAATAGAFAIAATRRMQRSGLRPPPKKPLPPPPTTVLTLPPPDGAPDPTSPEGPIATTAPIALTAVLTFRRPRLLISGFPGFILGVFGSLMVASRESGAMVFGAVCVLIAAVDLVRAGQTKVLIGPTGIVDIGVVRTRRYTWDDVAALRLVAEPGNQRETVHLIEAGGRDRLLLSVAGLAGAHPELARLCEVVTGMARAPAPVPTPPRPGPWRNAGTAIALGLFGVILALLLLAAFAGTNHASMDPAKVPAGRPYVRYVRIDGTLSPASVDCPSLASWIGGNRDPLCGDATRTAAVLNAVLTVVTAAFLGGAVLVWRARGRFRREHGASRRQ